MFDLQSLTLNFHINLLMDFKFLCANLKSEFKACISQVWKPIVVPQIWCGKTCRPHILELWLGYLNVNRFFGFFNKWEGIEVILKVEFTQKFKFSHYLLNLFSNEKSLSKHFWRFAAKQHCCIFQNNWRGWQLFFKKTQNTQTNIKSIHKSCLD